MKITRVWGTNMWANWYEKTTMFFPLTVNTKSGAGTGRDILAQISLSYFNIYDGDAVALSYVDSYRDDNNPNSDITAPGKWGVRQIDKCREVTFMLAVFGPIEVKCSIVIGFST